MPDQPKPTADQIAKAKNTMRGVPVGDRLTAEQAEAQQLLADADARRDDH
jgi:hypothetical protein